MTADTRHSTPCSDELARLRDEVAAENHAIFTVTGPPRDGLTLAQELRAQHEELREEIAERSRRAFSLLEDYIAAYPPDVFPPPPKGQHGRTVDSCSAAALRAVLPNVLRDLREILDPAGRLV